MKIEVLNQKGKAAGEITVSDVVFKADRNDPLIHAVATAQANNQRQGTKSALTRSEVRGHSAKPYRQKGTGRARQGSTKGPHQKSGGVAFAPKPRDFTTKINKKQRTAAFVSAISGKLTDKELVVLDNTKIKDVKTKSVASILKALKMEAKSVLFVTTEYDPEFVRCSDNIPFVDVTTASQLSVYDIVNSKFLVASVDAIKNIEEAYA